MMQNSFNRPGQDISEIVTMREARPNTLVPPHLLLNIPLLLSLLVAIINLALLRNQQTQNAGLQLNIPSLALVLALLFTLGMLYHQSMSSWHDRQAMIRLCTTALLGSLLLGLSALMLVNITGSSSLSAFGIVLSILSICGLLLFILRYPAEYTEEQLLQQLTQTQQQAGELRQALDQAYLQLNALSRVSVPPGGIPLPPPGDPASTPPPAIKPDFSLVPTQPAQVIAEDPLTHVPTPRKRASFFTMSKTNDPRPIINEDVCVISPNENIFALCDGASGSQLPRAWGFYLGQQWLRNRRLYDERGTIDAKMLAQWLEAPRQNWYYWVAHIWQARTNESNRQAKRPPVSPELLNQTLQKGAAATFLGLHIENNRWYATVIGDSCLFQLSASGQLKSVMPPIQSASFGQTPPLLSSRPDSDLNMLAPFIQCFSSTYDRGESLLMATDALSQWLLSQSERIRLENGREQEFWQQWNAMPDQKTFEQSILNLRQRQEIEEDDTSLVIIRL